MKLKDIQPHTVYAVFDRRTYDSGRLVTAAKWFFTPQQLEKGLNYHRELGGYYLRHPWWFSKGKEIPTWDTGSARLQNVQMPWNEYLTMKAEDEARKKQQAEERAQAYQNSLERGEELKQYLTDNRAALEAIGLTIPQYLSEYGLRGGRVEMHLNKEQLENILARVSQEVTV